MGSMILLDSWAALRCCLWAAHGPQRESCAPSARMLRRFLGLACATASWLSGRNFRDGAAPEQHRHRPDDGVVRHGGCGRPGSRPSHHAGRECLEPRSSSRCCRSLCGGGALLFLVGVTAFKAGWTTRTRDLGRVAIGVGPHGVGRCISFWTLWRPRKTRRRAHAFLEAITDDPLLWRARSRSAHLGCALPA